MIEQFSLLYPKGYSKNDSDIMKHQEFVESLGISTLLGLKQEIQKNFYAVEWNRLFTSNEEVLAYRIDIVEDILCDEKILEVLNEILPLISDIYEISMLKTDYAQDNAESDIYSVSELEAYTDVIDILWQGLEKCRFKSEGLMSLKRITYDIVQNDNYKMLKSELKKLMQNVRNIKSINIGINLDGTFKPYEAGIVEINSEVFRSGNILDRLLNLEMKKEKFSCIAPLISIKGGVDSKDRMYLEKMVYGSLNTIFKKSIKGFPTAIRRYVREQITFLTSCYSEIKFLSCACKFLLELKKMGFPVTKAKICPKEEKTCRLWDTYNPFIALQEKKII